MRTHKTLNAQALLAVAVLETNIKPVPMNPLFLDARDKSASIPENCLPLTASAGTKADTFHSLSHRFNR